MLVLTRELLQAVVVDGPVTVRVMKIAGSRIKLSFEADSSVRILREEVWLRIQGEEARKETPQA